MAAPAPPPVDTNKIHSEEELHEDATRPHLGARFSDGKSLSEYTTNLSEKNGSSRYANSTIGLDLNGEARRSERKLVAKLGTYASPATILRLWLTDSRPSRPAHSPAGVLAVFVREPRPVRHISSHRRSSRIDSERPTNRGNLGNAKLQGLYETLLDNNPTKYSIALCCFL